MSGCVLRVGTFGLGTIDRVVATARADGLPGCVLVTIAYFLAAPLRVGT